MQACRGSVERDGLPGAFETQPGDVFLSDRLLVPAGSAAEVVHGPRQLQFRLGEGEAAIADADDTPGRSRGAGSERRRRCAAAEQQIELWQERRERCPFLPACLLHGSNGDEQPGIVANRIRDRIGECDARRRLGTLGRLGVVGSLPRGDVEGSVGEAEDFGVDLIAAGADVYQGVRGVQPMSRRPTNPTDGNLAVRRVSVVCGITASLLLDPECANGPKQRRTPSVQSAQSVVSLDGEVGGRHGEQALEEARRQG